MTHWLTLHSLPTANAWDPLPPPIYFLDNTGSVVKDSERNGENELLHFLVAGNRITASERLSGESAFPSGDTFLCLHSQDSYIAGSICESVPHSWTNHCPSRPDVSIPWLWGWVSAYECREGHTGNHTTTESHQGRWNPFLANHQAYAEAKDAFLLLTLTLRVGKGISDLKCTAPHLSRKPVSLTVESMNLLFGCHKRNSLLHVSQHQRQGHPQFLLSPEMKHLPNVLRFPSKQWESPYCWKTSS